MNGLLAVGVGITGAGVVLATALSGRGPTRFDRVMRRFALRCRTEPRTRLAQAISFLGKPSSTAFASGVAALVVDDPRARRRLTIAATLRIVIETGCKHLFARNRPPRWMQVGVQRGPSLPSGHSLAILPFLTIAEETGRARVAAVALGSLVGLTRIYLEKHNATDVAVGLLLGVGVACVLESPSSAQQGSAFGSAIKRGRASSIEGAA